MFKTKQFDYTTLNESAMKRGFACNIVCFKSNSDPYVLSGCFHADRKQVSGFPGCVRVPMDY